MTLESRLSHPCFPQPIDLEVKLWRYMDLSKFIWLISRRQLYLSRLDQLEDEFEGSSTRKTLDGIRLFFENLSQPHDENFGQIYLNARKRHYVNCWYCGNAESEAMWRLYCPNKTGVAIQTTYNKLAHSIKDDENLYIGKVTYADYEFLSFPDANLFWPIMHKRLSFAHENEVRIACSNYMPEGEVQPLGYFVDWDPCEIVEKIYVDPYGPEYHFLAVKTALQAMVPEWEIEVEWSQLKSAPVFK